MPFGLSGNTSSMFGLPPLIGTRCSIDCHSVSPQLWRRYFKRAASTWTACHLGSRRPWFRCPAYTGELLRFARQCSPMARHPASMSMKSILRRGGVLRDASGARQSTCRIRMWFDHHKLAGPSSLPRSSYRNHLAKSMPHFDCNVGLWQFRLRVTHHAILPKHDQGMHRAPTGLSRNHHDSLPVTVHF